jgi:hypothetical protein
MEDKMNEYTIQYQNFHPSTFTKDYLDAKIGGLALRAPLGSVVRAVFTVENGGITATLRVATASGDFFASSKGRFLKDVNRRLLIQARRQINRWHQNVRAA